MGAVVTLVILALAAIEWRRRQWLYWYPVASDYEYRFRGGWARFVPVHLSRDGFVMPPVEGATVLLRLDVEPGLGSGWSAPSIDVRVRDQLGCRQHFERRAKGVRYLNLCATAGGPAAGDTVRLRGRHMGWRPQTAQLIAFPTPELGRILVIAPHADDAEIGAFGLYANRDSWTVTVTSGSYGGAAYRHLGGSPAERELLQARLRIWDALAATTWANLRPERAVILGFATDALEQMHAHPARPATTLVGDSLVIRRWRAQNVSDLLEQRPASGTWENLVGDLTWLIDTLRPTTIVAPHPALDANRDHVFSTVALLDALERLGDPPTNLLLYTNHHRLSEHFPFGPASAAVTLPPWLDSTTVFRSVYSHSLSRQQVIDKLFALDQMHDLRRPPEFVDRDPIIRFIQRLGGALGEIWQDPAQDNSYFRRAVRPNELFFHYSTDDRALLQQQAAVRPGDL